MSERLNKGNGMKKILILGFIFIIIQAFSDPSNPKAQRGKITFLSSEMWTDAVDGIKRYPVRNLVDNNPLTAWVFEPKFSSQKKTIGMAMKFSESIDLDGISIINGYAKSESLYKANNAIELFELILSSGQRLQFECLESLKPQNFNFKKQKLDWIILIVKKVRRGTRYDDLCISELAGTLNNVNILNDEDDIIISNSGGEYESDKIYRLNQNLRLNTVEWGFGCDSQNGSFSPLFKLLVYSDGCNDYGNAVVLDLKTMEKKSFDSGIWADHWIVGIYSSSELIVSDGEYNFLFNTITKKKKPMTISKTEDEESLWNWGRRLDEILKGD